MSDKSYTPGPWKADDSQVRTAINAKGKHIAMVNIGYDIQDAEHKANARLIAAAPELLEALEDTVEALRHLERIDPDCDISLCLDDIKEHEMLIAKVKGD